MNRERFINELEQLLKKHGFVKNDNIYSFKRIHVQPGATMNINGQVIQQPSKEIPIKYVIKDNGEGWMADADETNKQYFTQLKFEVLANNTIQKEIEYCLFYDTEINDNLLNLFNL